MKQRLIYSAVLILLGLGLFLRLFNRDQAMYYKNDQGLLLLTSYDVVFYHHVPLVGPPISFGTAVIPPFMYYLVGSFMAFGRDPLAVALGYIMLNSAGALLLSYYAWLLFDAATALWTLGLVMLSSSMVENGRSIWQAHPTFSFVVFYLCITELAFRKKNIWLYCLGVVLYVVSTAMYPTPLLLLPYVVVRTAWHFRSFRGTFRQSIKASILLVGGVLAAIFVPWIVSDIRLWQSITASIAGKLSPVSLVEMVKVTYINASTILHDLFSLGAILPRWMVGAPWLKLAVASVILLILLTLKKATLRTYLRMLFHLKYQWLLVGFLVPVAIGMKMPAHRLLPFYPFVFLLLAWWVRNWIADRRNLRTFVAAGVLTVFLVGNALSWRATTITHPKREYDQAVQIAQTIVSDVAQRHLTGSDIGVHYVTPLDGNDYYASPVYYLLRLAINYPVAYTPLGNELDRGKIEDHIYVYLVCAGFGKDEEKESCISPFLARWKGYALMQKYTVSAKETIVVLQRS